MNAQSVKYIEKHQKDQLQVYPMATSLQEYIAMDAQF